MAGLLVLIDVNKVLVSDTRDVSEYVAEAIRSRYGLQPEVNVDEYEGFTAQEMIADVLRKNGLKDDEINPRLEGCAEELGYSYYNVTGRESIEVMDGAGQLLDELGRRGALVGIATGEVEDQVKNRLHRAGLDGRIGFGSYGNRETDMKAIMSSAARLAAERGFDRGGKIVFLGSSPKAIGAAKELGFGAIGVASGRYSKEQLKEAGADTVVSGVKERGRILKAVFG